MQCVFLQDNVQRKRRKCLDRQNFAQSSETPGGYVWQAGNDKSQITNHPFDRLMLAQGGPLTSHRSYKQRAIPFHSRLRLLEERRREPLPLPPAYPRRYRRLRRIRSESRHIRRLELRD